jgi:hypothetical protein
LNKYEKFLEDGGSRLKKRILYSMLPDDLVETDRILSERAELKDFLEYKFI